MIRCLNLFVDQYASAAGAASSTHFLYLFRSVNIHLLDVDHACRPVSRLNVFSSFLSFSSHHAHTHTRALPDLSVVLMNVNCARQVTFLSVALVTYPGRAYIRRYQAWLIHRCVRCRRRLHRNIRLGETDNVSLPQREIFRSCISSLSLSLVLACHNSCTEVRRTTWCSKQDRKCVCGRALVYHDQTSIDLLSRYCRALACRGMKRIHRLHRVCLKSRLNEQIQRQSQMVVVVALLLTHTHCCPFL